MVYHSTGGSIVPFCWLQWEFEKWKYAEHTQLLLYSANTQLPLRIKQDGSIDASGDYTDTFGQRRA